MFIVGMMADGGGDLTVVVESDRESIVLFVVDSVTTVCASAKVTHKANKAMRIDLVVIHGPMLISSYL